MRGAAAAAGLAEKAQPREHGAGLPRIPKPRAPGRRLRRLCARPRCNKARRPPARGRGGGAGSGPLRSAPRLAAWLGRRRLGRGAQPGLGTALALRASPPSRKGFFFFFPLFLCPPSSEGDCPEDAAREGARGVPRVATVRSGATLLAPAWADRLGAGQAGPGLCVSLARGLAAAWLGGRRPPLQSYGPGTTLRSRELLIIAARPGGNPVRILKSAGEST